MDWIWFSILAVAMVEAALARDSESELTTASAVLLKLMHMAVRHELLIQAALRYSDGVSRAVAASSASEAWI